MTPEPNPTSPEPNPTSPVPNPTSPEPNPTSPEPNPTSPEPVEGPSREIVSIAAVARNGVIGAAGDIPWRIPGDQPRFKKITSGHVLIMGRKTYDSIGRPLPGRKTIVITRNRDWHADGVESVDDLQDALERAAELDPAGPTFIAGGGDIYRAAMPYVQRLEITEIDQEPDGDATFPEIDADLWEESDREDRDGFAWVSYRRREAAGS